MRSILVGRRPELGEDVFQRVQRRIDRVAAGAQPEVVAGDLPAFAQFFRHGFGTESVADQVGEGLLDGVRLCGHAGQGQFRRERAGEATHPARHVQRGGARDGVGVAGGEDEDRADPERRAHLVARQSAQPRPGRHRAQERRLAILVGDRPGGHRRTQPDGDVVAEDQRGQRLPSGPLQPFGAGQRGRQDLHGGLGGDEAVPLAQLDRAPRQPVEQRRRARIRRRPARRVDGRAAATGRGQSRPRAGHFGLHRAGHHHAQRVQQHELGVLPHRLGNRLPRRIGREPRQLLDCVSHRALLRKSKVGYFDAFEIMYSEQPPLRSDSKDVAVYHDKSHGRGQTRHRGSRRESHTDIRCLLERAVAIRSCASRRSVLYSGGSNNSRAKQPLRREESPRSWMAGLFGDHCLGRARGAPC